MKILALDQSTTNVGYCIFNNQEYVESNVIKVHKSNEKKQNEYDFVNKSFQIIINLINTYNPDVLVLEEVFAGKSSSVLKQLATLKGMVLGYCYSIQLETCVVYPTQWKSFIRVNGGRSKEKQDVLNFFEQKYNITINKDDESDAIGIGYYFINKNNK